MLDEITLLTLYQPFTTEYQLYRVAFTCSRAPLTTSNQLTKYNYDDTNSTFSAAAAVTFLWYLVRYYKTLRSAAGSLYVARYARSGRKNTSNYCATGGQRSMLEYTVLIVVFS